MTFVKDADAAGPLPVTVVLTRHARPGRETEFEELLHSIAEVALQFPGHQGVSVLSPDAGSGGPYTIVLRFTDQPALDHWLESDERAALMVKADDLTLDPMVVRSVSGLEGWFRLPGAAVVIPPPRWKTAIVTYLAILPLIEIFNVALVPRLSVLPALARPVLVTAITITLMTWVVMPAVTHATRRFLY